LHGHSPVIAFVLKDCDCASAYDAPGFNPVQFHNRRAQPPALYWSADFQSAFGAATSVGRVSGRNLISVLHRTRKAGYKLVLIILGRR
jgi:hypothetical protein